MTIKQKKEAHELVSNWVTQAEIRYRLLILIDYQPREKKPLTDAQLEARRKGGREAAKVRTPTMYKKMRAARTDKMLDRRGMK